LAFRPELSDAYLGDVKYGNLSYLVADEYSLVDVILEHGEELLLLRDSQDEGETGAVADSEDLVLGD
jgi:hypothetical protein